MNKVKVLLSIILIFLIVGVWSASADAKGGKGWGKGGKPQPTPTATAAASPSPTASPTPTSTATPSTSPTVTPTPSPTTTPTTSPSPTVTADPCIHQDLNAVVANATGEVCINGFYRLTEPLNPGPGVTLTGNGVLDGSKVLSNWYPLALGGWRTNSVLPPAYSDVGQCEDNVNNPCQLREQVFVNDVRLTRVTDYADLAPGTFYADYNSGSVTVGSDPSGQVVTMSSTDYAIRSTASNVTINGLTIQKFASPSQRGAVFVEGKSWTVTNTNIRWNHAIGLYLTRSDNTYVAGNNIYSNGQLGYGHHRSLYTLSERNNIYENNAEGYWVTDWESGGFKATYSIFDFVDNNVYANKGIGVWGDGDNRLVTISRNNIYDNEADGVRYEISYDAVITQNTVTNNNWGTGRGKCNNPYCGGGINSNTSKNVEIAYNTVTDNQNGVVLRASNRGSGELGPWVLEDNYVHDNSIQMAGTNEWGQNATGLVQNTGDNSYFTTRGNRFANNTYTLASPTGRQFAWNNTYMTYQNWIANGQN